MTQGVVTVQGLRLRDGPGGAIVVPNLDKGVGGFCVAIEEG